MSAQNSLNAITGSLIGGALALSKTTEGLDKFDKSDLSEDKKPDISGKDIKMAARARKNVQQKINAIYANKELSAKARTRRVGKIIDEYQGGGK